MTDVNIVSTDARFCRLLELEVKRLGLSSQISDAPIADSKLCLMDGDTCTTPLPSSQTLLLLFGGKNNKEPMPHVTASFSKPFLVTELRRTLLDCLSHQQQMPEKTDRPKAPPKYDPQGARLVIHHKTKTATVSGGEPVKLSDTEYKLLCRLREYGKKPLSAADASDILGDTESNKFNVYICYLRRKLERGNLRLIRTVRGKGYTLHPNERTKS